MEDVGAKQSSDVIVGGLSSCPVGCLPSVVAFARISTQ